MRKLFTYLAVAALVAVACDDMYGPVETPTAPDKAGSVKIQLDTLGDDTLAFTISPEGVASYYSYVVTSGPASAMDSAAVYQCKIDGLIKGTFHAATDSSATLTLGGLAPNTPYTIYAVAGSPQGIPGSVSVKEVTTTDGVTIECVDYDDSVTDSTIVLSFSEKVFLGKGEVTASYYARNLKYKEMGTVAAVADSIIVDGNTVTVQFAGLPHGAYYAVSWPEGMFTDSKGNKIEAMESGYVAEAGKFAGIYARKDTVAFALVDTLATEYTLFLDPTTAEFVVEVAGDEELAKYNSSATVSFVTSKKTVTIGLEEDETIAYAMNAKGKSQITMTLPDEPIDYGTAVVFDCPQDAFQDIWGNPTKAVKYNAQYSYGYTYEDVVGEYDVVAFNNDMEDYEAGTMKIEKSDDEEAGNVMITDFMGIQPETPIYGTFDFDAGVLSLYGWQYLMTEEDVNVNFFCYYNEFVNLYMTESGVFTAADDCFGYYFTIGTPGGDDETPIGWQLYLSFYAQKASSEAEPAPSEAPSAVKLDISKVMHK